MLWLDPKLIKLQASLISPTDWPYALTSEALLKIISQGRREAAAFLRYYRRLSKEQQTGELAQEARRILDITREARRHFIQQRDELLAAPSTQHPNRQGESPL